MKFIDMFAGIGGFRSGLEKAGHECTGYIEWDKYARKSYQAIYNTEGEFTANDIREVKGIELPDVDLWTFGSPCQDISIAGKQCPQRLLKKQLTACIPINIVSQNGICFSWYI